MKEKPLTGVAPLVVAGVGAGATGGGCWYAMVGAGAGDGVYAAGAAGAAGTTGADPKFAESFAICSCVSFNCCSKLFVAGGAVVDDDAGGAYAKAEAGGEYPVDSVGTEGGGTAGVVAIGAL